MRQGTGNARLAGMFRKESPIRQEATLPFDGEAALSPVSGLVGARLPAKDRTGSGFLGFQSKSASPEPDFDSPEQGTPDPESAHELARRTNPSALVGVPEV